jgi:glycogenin glucosyltransferase
MDLIMMMVDGSEVAAQNTAISELTAAGWNIICTVPAIEHPNLSVPRGRFHEAKLYSKLNAWALTEYEAILFVDSDTLIIRSPAPLFTFHLPAMKRSNATFAAVRDRPARLSHGFNAGVFLLILDKNRGDTAFLEIRDKITSVAHDETQAEQGLLNAIYDQTFFELPFIYNANLVSKLEEPGLWNENEHAISILHYTISKPWSSFAHWDYKDIRQSFDCWKHDTGELCKLWEQT